jgi:hypothetical protein
MGHDFAGVVEAVGAGVTRLKAGDAVLGVARFRQAGAFAETVTAPEKAVVLKPVDPSYERAAALPTVGVTAYQATAEVRPGHAVFVNGCLGGAGRTAVQFARAREARCAARSSIAASASSARPRSSAAGSGGTLTAGARSPHRKMCNSHSWTPYEAAPVTTPLTKPLSSGRRKLQMTAVTLKRCSWFGAAVPAHRPRAGRHWRQGCERAL